MLHRPIPTGPATASVQAGSEPTAPLSQALPSMTALALSAVALVAGCAGPASMPAPTAKNVAYAERHGQVTTLPALKLGRKLYISRCASCHDLNAPEHLSPREWPETVRRMADDSRITPDQERAITQYLVSVSAAVRDTSAQGTPSAPK